MQIQILTGHNIEDHEAITTHFSGLVEKSLSRFSDRITQADVHLSNENSDKTDGSNYMRCMIEARLKGQQLLAVTHQAATLSQAIDGAADKLTIAIDSTLERLHHQENHRTDPPLSSLINSQ